MGVVLSGVHWYPEMRIYESHILHPAFPCIHSAHSVRLCEQAYRFSCVRIQCHVLRWIRLIRKMQVLPYTLHGRLHRVKWLSLPLLRFQREFHVLYLARYASLEYFLRFHAMPRWTYCGHIVHGGSTLRGLWNGSGYGTGWRSDRSLIPYIHLKHLLRVQFVLWQYRLRQGYNSFVLSYSCPWW